MTFQSNVFSFVWGTLSNLIGGWQKKNLSTIPTPTPPHFSSFYEAGLKRDKHYPFVIPNIFNALTPIGIAFGNMLVDPNILQETIC